MKIVEIDGSMDAAVFGGKASGLAVLKQHGLLIPDSSAIEICTQEIVFTEELKEELKRKLSRFEKKGKYCVAVRSSAAVEDSFEESMSGFFISEMGEFCFEELLEAMNRVIHSLDGIEDPYVGMGIVIQKLITADYAGVIYSSDPLTYCKSDMVIGIVEGRGDQLVSGVAPGADIHVSLSQNSFLIRENDIGDFITMEVLQELCKNIKHLEQQLGYPVDVEWAVKGNTLFYLQCRPLASIMKISTEIISFDQQQSIKLPLQILEPDRVKLWNLLLEQGIRFPNISYYIHNSARCQPGEQFLLRHAEGHKGYTVTMIYPPQNAEEDSSFFVGDKKKVLGGVTGCCRYGIRSFPKYENLAECIDSICNIAGRKYWISMIGVQDVFEPLYTGMLQKTDEGYLIELIRGKFITKGLMPTSKYLIGKDGEIQYREEQQQEAWYQVIEGHVVYCVCNNEEKSVVALQNQELFFLLQYFRSVLDNFPNTIEFGIMRNRENGSILPYFMDFVNKNIAEQVFSMDITSGILSLGKVIGRIVYIKPDLIDEIKVKEPSVFFCSNPDVALLRLIRRCDTIPIGFVFEKGSVLCHVAAILRERRIPAVQIGNLHTWKYSEGRVCSLDASTQGISFTERITVLE